MALGSLVNYDNHYVKGQGQCGEPFREFVEFFEKYEKRHAIVLDLGCGQGRDALLAARLGHEVVGVDLSEIGIKQMLEDAKRGRLNITGMVTDAVEYKSRRKFDIVILDRTLHLLIDDDERGIVLAKAARYTKKGGYVLIADTPKHAQQIQDFFPQSRDKWEVTKRTKNFLFAKKLVR